MNYKLVGLIILALVPWPGPTVFKIKCPRDSAAIVRRLVQNKWIPVLEKYQAKLPIECPFHPMRDIYFPQESAKRQYRSSQWTCGFCGKSFYQEKFLELHFSNRHRNNINMAEDAVCLADYCDIMRCEVFQKQYEKESESNEFSDSSQLNKNGKNGPITDLEVWREPSQKNALSVIPQQTKINNVKKKFQNQKNLCDKSEAPKNDHKKNTTEGGCESLVDSVIPPRQRFIELQKLKANCKSEDLLKLKTRCEHTVRDCIAGLLIDLSVQDFKDIEAELNNAVCWYLTCDRYWEDTQTNTRTFSMRLYFIPIILLCLGMSICYYIIWNCFKNDDVRNGNPEDPDFINYRKQYSDEYYPASDENPTSDNYIYVTYPPEIKRRLLDSCYNRTTRL